MRGPARRNVDEAREGDADGEGIERRVRRLGRDEAEIALSQVACEMWHHLRDLVGDDGGFVPSGQIKLAEDASGIAKLEAGRKGGLVASARRHKAPESESL